MVEKRKLSVLGCTGSVGSNTLNVCRQFPDRFEVVSLSCGSSAEQLASLIDEFEPKYVSVGSEQAAAALRKLTSKPSQIFVGTEGHRALVEEAKPDALMCSMLGTYGLHATLQAVKQSTPIVGVANKEILVMAGPFIMEALESSSSKLIPVDSEHSAIFQCLMGNERKELRKIILTASGGPFRARDAKTFESIKKEDALKHPNWVMGAKITIDSATMMNKGLEYIEALRLFQVTPDQMEIVVHPESIVHSMVEYQDGSVMAQLGVSDMKIPIALALSYPERLPVKLDSTLDFRKLAKLHFEEPDLEKFPCLDLAIRSEALGSHGPVILNAANEIAVARFLGDEIGFMDIPRTVEAAFEHFSGSRVASLDDALALDLEVKTWAKSIDKAA